MLVQGVHAGPQAEVQDHVAVFHQQVVVAGAAVGDRGPSGAFRHPAQHAVVAVSPADPGGRQGRAEIQAARCIASGTGPAGVPRQHQLPAGSQVLGPRRLAGLHRNETDGVAGAQLAQLPAVGRHHGHGADETAQAGTVRAEQDGSVAGEVEGTHRIRGVVDVRRVQSRLAAVAARPPRFGADEADTGAGGVEVHFVAGRVEILDVLALEELGSAMRALHDRQLPCGCQHRPAVQWNGAGLARYRRPGGRRRIQSGVSGHGPEHIAGPEDAAAMAAELAQGEGGRAAQVLRHVEPALEQNVAAEAGAFGSADIERASRGHRHRFPGRHFRAVHGECGVGTGHAHRRGMGEVQAGTGHGELQPGCAFAVAECLVAEPEGQVIHRAAGRNPYLPQAGTAGPVLDGGLQSGPVHGDPGFRVAQVIQGAGAVGGVADHVQGGHAPEHPEVCLDAVDPGGLQRRAEPKAGVVCDRERLLLATRANDGSRLFFDANG